MASLENGDCARMRWRTKVIAYVALEAHQHRNRSGRDPFAPRLSAALVHCRRHASLLDCAPDAPHLPRVTPEIPAACTQLSCPTMALVISSRRVIARPLSRSSGRCAGPFPIPRTSLNVYAPDISNVYDTRRVVEFSRCGFLLESRPAMRQHEVYWRSLRHDARRIDHDVARVAVALNLREVDRVGNAWH